MAVFRGLELPALHVQCKTREKDLWVKPGCVALDARVALPNINDGFEGKAPDLGCCGVGVPALRYSPRPEWAAGGAAGSKAGATQYRWHERDEASEWR